MKVKVYNHDFNVNVAVIKGGKAGLSIEHKGDLLDQTIIPLQKFHCKEDNEYGIKLLTAKGIGDLLTWRETSKYAANFTLKVMRRMGFRISFANLKTRNIITLLTDDDCIIINNAWTGANELASIDQLDEVIRDIIYNKAAHENRRKSAVYAA